MWSLHDAVRKEELVHLAITGTYKRFLVKLYMKILLLSVETNINLDVESRNCIVGD